MSWSERGSTARAFVALAWVRVALPALGFRRVHARLARLADGPIDPIAGAPGPARNPVVDATARAVDRAARCGPRQPSCLPRALTLWWLLRRQGIAAELRIGARRVADRLEAHAWVECDGRVLNDHADIHDRFAAFGGPIRSMAGFRTTGSTRLLGGSRG